MWLKRLAVTGVLLALAAAVAAQETTTVITDRTVYPVPEPPELPKAGETFVDPTFGTTLMRVTDEGDGKQCQHVYSYYHTFNRDSTRFHIQSGGKAMLYRFDPQAFRVLGKAPLFAARPPGGSEPRWDDTLWSATDPDVAYCHTGLKLWEFNVATGKYTLIRDFAGTFEPGYIWQMSKSLDDGTFAFSLQDPKWHVVGFAAWKRDTDKVLIHEKANPGFDEVQLDKTGRYLVIKTGRQGRNKVIRVRVADLDTGKTWDLTDYEPDWAPGHSDNGHGTVVGMDAHTPRVTLRKLSDPHTFTTVLKWGDDWSQGRHLSMLADDEGWVLISAYTGNKLKSNGLFRDEIMQAATDGSARVRRLCHHHSVVREYWESPRANISRDGRFVCFTSNWGGSDRRDVFILKVPKPDRP